jgi:hypothetical protein
VRSALVTGIVDIRVPVGIDRGPKLNEILRLNIEITFQLKVKNSSKFEYLKGKSYHIACIHLMSNFSVQNGPTFIERLW